MHVLRVLDAIALQRTEIVSIPQLCEQILENGPVPITTSGSVLVLEMGFDIGLDVIVVEKRIVDIDQEDDLIYRSYPYATSRTRLQRAAKPYADASACRCFSIMSVRLPSPNLGDTETDGNRSRRATLQSRTTDSCTIMSIPKYAETRTPRRGENARLKTTRRYPKRRERGPNAGRVSAH